MQRLFPKLIVFDLDGTLWSPEMYELWGGGAPFTAVDNGDHLLDRKKTKVRLLGTSRKILENLTQMAEFKTGNISLAFASTTDEPEWARECLEKFKLHGGRVAMGSIVPHQEVYKARDKSVHFRALQTKTGIAFTDMIFFDNQMNNIRDVQKLGVVCVYCPDGMTDEVWRTGLGAFAKARGGEKDTD